MFTLMPFEREMIPEPSEPPMQMQQEQEQTQVISHRLRELLLDYDFEGCEAMSGIAASGWGLIVLAPWVSTFGTTPTFNAMRDLAPEWVWGLVIAFIGISQLGTLIRRQNYWRRHFAFAACVMWLFMSTMFIIANPWATATVIYPTLALAAAWAYWRLSLLTRVR